MTIFYREEQRPLGRIYQLRILLTVENNHCPYQILLDILIDKLLVSPMGDSNCVHWLNNVNCLRSTASNAQDSYHPKLKE